MPASHVDHERPSVRARSHLANTVWTSTQPVVMRMEREIAPRSESYLKWSRCPLTDGSRAFGSLHEKIADYEAMLRDLSIRVGTEDANSIKALLEKVCLGETLYQWLKGNLTSCACQGSNTGDTDIVDGGDSSQWQDLDSASGAESEGHASAGSTGAVDRIDEDFNRSESARSTGFIGKNSEIAWLQKLKREQLSGTPTGADMSQQTTNISKGSLPSPVLFLHTPSLMAHYL